MCIRNIYFFRRYESLKGGVKNRGVTYNHLHIITWIKVYFRGNTVLLTSLTVGFKKEITTVF